jgi:hypothetical protein
MEQIPGLLRDVEDVDDYDKKILEYIEKEKKIIAMREREIREIKNESTHICPYGCGRRVPNEFKGCTELLQARPNYYG